MAGNIKRVLAWVILLTGVFVSGCTIGIDEPEIAPLLEGVYSYSAHYLGSEQIVFSGVLLLEDGAKGEVAGSYRFPNQCSLPDEAATEDCVGSIYGKVEEDHSFVLNFAGGELFRHVGVLKRDGRLEGTWIFEQEGDEDEEVSVVTGVFVASPNR